MQEMQEMWVQSLGQEHPMEEEMATHSSILARVIPWTEEPAELKSIESQRVRYDWACMQTHMIYKVCNILVIKFIFIETNKTELN